MVPLLGELAGAWFWWIAIASFIAAIAAESAIPDRAGDFPAWRWTDHIALYAACIVLAGIIDPRPFVLALAPDQRATAFGFVDLVAGKAGVLVLGLLLLDLFVYAMHWLQHAVPVLWRFHAVHHWDEDMDASTSMRHHPLAYLQVAICVGIVFGLLGLPPWVFAIYGVILFLAALFQHVNMHVPKRIQRPLGWLLICPNMHRVHHSTDPAHFNCNFGNVLSIWDRLFGTLLVPTQAEEDRIVFGLQTSPGRTPWLWSWKMPFVMAPPEAAGSRSAIQYGRKA